MNRILTIFGMLLLIYSSAYSADIAVESSLDRNKGYMGDRIKYSLEVSADTSIKVDTVNIEQGLGDFEIKNWKIDTTMVKNEKKTIKYSGILTVYKTGKVMLPPIPVAYHSGAEQTDTIFTDSLDVYVMSLVMDDSTADIKDLKGVKSLGGLNAWIFIIAGLMAAGAGAFIWFFLRRRPGFEARSMEPLKSPWEEAREKLMLLQDAGLDPKPYYIKLSDIIRTYAERRFGFSATDMTTYEIKQEIPNLNLGDGISESMVVLLDNADLVKFAKFIPETDWITADFKRAWDFVERTIPGLTMTETEEVSA
jgi:hypothetical protein